MVAIKPAPAAARIQPGRVFFCTAGFSTFLHRRLFYYYLLATLRHLPTLVEIVEVENHLIHSTLTASILERIFWMSSGIRPATSSRRSELAVS